MDKLTKKLQGETKPKDHKSSPPKSEKKLSKEEEYNKLVDEASHEKIWSEPIKDLIDKYADLADKNRQDHEAEVIQNFTLTHSCLPVYDDDP